MKRRVSALLICLLFATLLSGCKMLQEDNSPYATIRNTVVAFGDGRFAIISRPNDLDSKKREWRLYDMDGVLMTLIEGDVYNYKEIAPYVYTVGEGGYKKLNYETGDCIKSRELEDFTSEDQEILKELERTKYEVSERKNPSK